MDDILTRELARYVLGKMGLVPPPNLGKLGMSTCDFLLEKKLEIEYYDADNQKRKSAFPLWCGETRVGQSRMLTVATDLFTTDQEYHEFCSVFIVDNLAVHGIKHIFSEHEEALFLIASDPKADWKPNGLYGKLMITAALEKMADLGIPWRPAKDYEVLFSKLVELVEM